MGIGTSLGAFYDDEHHYAASQWDDKYDNNIVTPNDMQQNKQLDQVEQTELGGTPISETYSINPMNDTENGVIPLAGAPETVGRAAVVIQGKTYTGDNHGFALGQFMDENKGIDLDKALKGYKDGFMTSKGRFVSREEAFDIAKDQNQIQDKVLPSLTADSKMLLSEDLKTSPVYNHDAHVEWRNK